MPYQHTIDENNVHSNPNELIPYYKFNRSFPQNQDSDEVTPIEGLKKIITGSQNSEALRDEVTPIAVETSFKNALRDAVTSIAIESGLKRIITGSQSGVLTIWDEEVMITIHNFCLLICRLPRKKMNLKFIMTVLIVL